jgi:hypothetical protein
MVLEKLSQIDWDAYNRQIDIPEMLRGLTSHKAETRWEAYDNIYNRIIHAGEIFGPGNLNKIYDVLKDDLVSVIVPFLIELLGDSATEDKKRILHLLEHMCQLEDIITLEEPYKTNANKIVDAICGSSALYLQRLQIETDIRSQSMLADFLSIAAARNIGSLDAAIIASELLKILQNSIPHEVKIYILLSTGDMFAENNELHERFKQEYGEILREIRQNSKNDELNKSVDTVSHRLGYE